MARRITIERHPEYSAGQWRLIDSETGSQVTVPIVFDHPNLGPTVIQECGWDTKAKALEALGEIAAHALATTVERS